MKHRKPTDFTVPVARAISAACLSAVVGPRGDRPAAREEEAGADDVEGASCVESVGGGREGD